MSLSRLFEELSKPEPYALPASLGVAQFREDPQLLRSVLQQAHDDLVGMNTKPCGFAHHRSWLNGGSQPDICSDGLRNNSLHCGHSARLPARGAVEALHRMEFISNDERESLLKTISGDALARADTLANALDVSITSAQTTNRDQREVMRSLGLDTSKKSGTLATQVESIFYREQHVAGAEIRALHANLIRGIAASLATEGYDPARTAFRNALQLSSPD